MASNNAEGLESKVGRLEGRVDATDMRLDSIDNWLRVLVLIQIMTLVAVIGLKFVQQPS